MGAVGSTVVFGRYPQSKDGAPQPIEWLVLTKEDGKALLISKYGLNAKPFHHEFTDITWEKCDLRAWLNDEFMNTAFTEEEQNKIVQVVNQNPNNAQYGTNGGNATRDRVFLLSIDEAQHLFKNDEARMCRPTGYAEDNGAYIDNGNGWRWWWLRSPGYRGYNAALVFSDGSVFDNGSLVSHGNNCVRPALWVSNL